MRKNGFTVVELLVVMVIIAFLAGLLLPAIRKSRSKAIIDKAKAEMANLASIMTMVKMDVGYYVRLRDLTKTDLPSNYTSGFPYYGSNWGGGGDATNENGVFAYYDPSSSNDSTDVESELTNGHNWDGPYITYQPKATYQPDNGSVPIVASGISGWGNLEDVVPFGTPLDPWGHTYLVAYNDTEKVMVIFSAGPNGKLETSADSTSTSGDDLLYKFR